MTVGNVNGFACGSHCGVGAGLGFSFVLMSLENGMKGVCLYWRDLLGRSLSRVKFAGHALFGGHDEWHEWAATSQA